MQSELIKQLIAVIVVIFVLTFGFKAIAMVQDRLCDTRLSTADIDIKSGVRTSQFGSFDKKAIPIGCIDKAIFVDLGRADKSLLDSYPAVKNSV
ncbi:hypothetical protein HYU07_03480, partial [Candidatus Woesearchaeota archaeon]|nr:hypothetical protein [Candidatus Woesearchaeota archaeon]